MNVYLLLFVEGLPFLALLAFGVRELALLDRYDRKMDEAE